jgi:L-lactate dehydrogenase complex protein LldG
MTARREILVRLGKGRPEPLGLQPGSRHYPDLAAQFTVALEAVHGEVIRAASQDDAVDKLRDLLTDLRAEYVVSHRMPLLEEVDLDLTFPDQTWTFPDETEDYRDRCAREDVGITGAEYALAETGTVVISSGDDKARATSLLPPVHIVLLAETRILPSIFEWVKLRPDPMPANLVLVSGPSKTADIEQTLIVGVHGPKRFIVVTYEENQ